MEFIATTVNWLKCSNTNHDRFHRQIHATLTKGEKKIYFEFLKEKNQLMIINKHKHLQYLHNATCKTKKKQNNISVVDCIQIRRFYSHRDDLEMFYALFNLERQLITIIKYYC